MHAAPVDRRNDMFIIRTTIFFRNRFYMCPYNCLEKIFHRVAQVRLSSRHCYFQAELIESGLQLRWYKKKIFFPSLQLPCATEEGTTFAGARFLDAGHTFHDDRPDPVTLLRVRQRLRVYSRSGNVQFVGYLLCPKF